MLHEEIGMPAMLEQTAEECCELAQACLKMARYLRGENPTGKDYIDILDSLAEKCADVGICMSEIEIFYRNAPDIPTPQDVATRLPCKGSEGKLNRSQKCDNKGEG